MNRLNKTGLAPIHLAAATGATDFLVELISRGADVSLPASSGSTALHFAAKNDRRGIVEVLLMSGADPACPNHEGECASELCTDSIIRELLTRNPSTPLNGSLPYAMSPINFARHSIREHVASGGNLSTSSSLQKELEIEPGLGLGGSGSSSGSGGSNGSASSSTRNVHYADDTKENNENIEILELEAAVLAAATETTVSSQMLENEDKIRAISKLCQNCDETKKKELRKVSNLVHYFIYECMYVNM